jgi:predicted nucleic-acid-binding Zn-ribbon protein
MKESGKCPKCGSADIRGPHRIQGQYHVKVDLPGMRTATFDSFTCTNCGYSELYTDSLGLDNLKTDGRKHYVRGDYQNRQMKIGNINANFTVTCSNCISPLAEEDVFCPNCGEKVE